HQRQCAADEQVGHEPSWFAPVTHASAWRGCLAVPHPGLLRACRGCHGLLHFTHWISAGGARAVWAYPLDSGRSLAGHGPQESVRWLPVRSSREPPAGDWLVLFGGGDPVVGVLHRRIQGVLGALLA